MLAAREHSKLTPMLVFVLAGGAGNGVSAPQRLNSRSQDNCIAFIETTF
jgi:hypothetical protein